MNFLQVLQNFYTNNKKESFNKHKYNLLFKVTNGYSILKGSSLIGISIIDKSDLWKENLYREQDKEFLFKALLLTKRYIY